MALERELATFQRVLPDLLADSAQVNRYVLIHGDEIVDTYPTFDEAVHAGYERFLMGPFLAKRITDREEPRFFPRSLQPCPS